MKAKKRKTAPKSKTVTCQVFSTCRCNICGGYIEEGDNVCANGHVIGQKYPVAK